MDQTFYSFISIYLQSLFNHTSIFPPTFYMETSNAITCPQPQGLCTQIYTIRATVHLTDTQHIHDLLQVLYVLIQNYFFKVGHYFDSCSIFKQISHDATLQYSCLTGVMQEHSSKMCFTLSAAWHGALTD